ncbi:uncharacterized protein LOC135826258 [Sycon ciliatum]|uniref:uncharacterized protein LOC135826258 n=1 Tax=Sycon ciliatum TaxID=27933 RepID=UPI0031F71F00
MRRDLARGCHNRSFSIAEDIHSETLSPFVELRNPLFSPATMMLVQSPMVPWLVLVFTAAVSTLPESHADQTTVQTLFCAGYDITVHTTPVTFAAATADCRREKLFILRLKDYNRRRNVECFTNITDGFMDNGTSDIWLRNYNRLNATINLETELVRNLTELASTAMQPFICAKDWNECEDPATKCPAGTFCENLKGGYVCEACGQGNASGRSTVDGRTGLITCEKGYYWTCSAGNCPRDSETPAKLVCKNQVLTNLPECAVGTPSFPSGYDASNVIIDPNTSTFACAAGYYAQCTVNFKCAGGLNNLPAIASQQAGRLVWTNLPTCHQLVVTGSGNGKQETIQMLAWWKWAVNAVGIALVVAMGIGLVLWRREQKSSSPRVGIPVPNTVNEDSGMPIYDSPYAN